MRGKDEPTERRDRRTYVRMDWQKDKRADNQNNGQIEWEDWLTEERISFVVVCPLELGYDSPYCPTFLIILFAVIHPRLRRLEAFCRSYPTKLRTEGRRFRVRELGSIQLFNVTSVNVVRFLPNSVFIKIQVYGIMVANLVLIWFIFTILLNMIRWCPVILHVFQALVISHRATALWRKYTVHNFGMDIPNLLNSLIITRNTIPFSSFLFLFI